MNLFTERFKEFYKLLKILHIQFFQTGLNFSIPKDDRTI